MSPRLGKLFNTFALASFTAFAMFPLGILAASALGA